MPTMTSKTSAWARCDSEPDARHSARWSSVTCYTLAGVHRPQQLVVEHLGVVPMVQRQAYETWVITSNLARHRTHAAISPPKSGDRARTAAVAA